MTDDLSDIFGSQGPSSDEGYDPATGKTYLTVNPLPVDTSALKDYAATLPAQQPNPLPTHQSYTPPASQDVYNALTGSNGQERYQLFPERIARSALSLPTDVMSGKVTTPSTMRNSGSEEDFSSDPLLQRVQDMAALMGGGGVAMAEKDALGTAGGKLVQPTTDAAIAPVFHSAVENAVNTASMKSAPPQQWLSTISNSKGVKPEELDWTGLKDWLGEQSGSVSKEQVQGYLQQNKVGLGEVNKNSPYDSNKIDDVRYRKDLDEIANEKYGEPYDHLIDSQQQLVRGTALTKQGIDYTKYSKYQLPGGENYREKLLTLPSANDQYIKFTDAMRAKYGDKPLGQMPMTNDEKAFIDKQINRFGEDGGNYKSSHWDEPNILAHIRMNDRNVEGKNALHIEEIQSDWHQQGREKGYKLPVGEESKYNVYDGEGNLLKSFDNENNAKRFRNENPRTREIKKEGKHETEFNRIDNKIINSGDETIMGNPDIKIAIKMATDKKIITPDEAKTYLRYSDSQRFDAVPDAPFKKTWLDLALKRVIREAAESGKDRISWTPGEAQAARYDLSKHVKEISHIKNSNGTYDIAATDHKGSDIPINDRGNMTEKDLENTFGKEIAKKIVNDEGSKYRGRNFKTLEGLDLKVGGEGMHYFYDKMLPAALEKLTGQKMKVGSLSVDHQYSMKAIPAGVGGAKRIAYNVYHNDKPLRSFSTEEEANDFINETKEYNKQQNADKKINYIDLPQSVKDTALHRGFPLFSSGLMLNPVQDDPFKKSKYKLVPVKEAPKFK